MAANHYDKRRSVDDILASAGSGFNDMWNATPAASDDFEPIPAGLYRALLTDGRVHESATGTTSYRIEFTIIEGKFENRRIWHHCWLTRNALAMTKRDLAKLGILTPEQLRGAPPTGLLCEVRVALVNPTDASPRNEVRGFKVVDNASLAIDFEDDTPPDAEETGDATFDPEAF